MKLDYSAAFAVVLAVSRANGLPGTTSEQAPLAADEVDQGTEIEYVPSNTNATYGPVPKAEQIFNIQFLDNAPWPMPEDEFTFFWLRGGIDEQYLRTFDHKLLTNATMSIGGSIKYPSGDIKRDEGRPFPLKTVSNDKMLGHLAIRNEKGEHVEYLSATGTNDILADLMFLAIFIEEGEYTFEVVARLEDGTCLFAVTLTQRLHYKGW